MQDLPLVSIIIPTYNRAKMLSITIDSFLAMDYPRKRLEIIVVNNNSSDATEACIKSYSDHPENNVHYLFEKRQGVHYARNSGAKLAKGEILYFTDDDMIATSTLLNELVKVFLLDAAVGTVTGKVIGKFEQEPPEWVDRYLINGLLSLTEKNRKEDLIISREDPGVFSCHQAIKKEAFFASGGFNPENTAGVWIGDGETGLNIKVQKLGYKFAYVSTSVIYHMIPPGRMTTKYLINRIGNQAYCDAYTDFRIHQKKELIIPRMIKRNTLTIAKKMAILLLQIMLKKRDWRFFPATLMYFHKRNIYELKLYKEFELRKIVLIDDWINNDPTINVKW